MSNIDKYYYYRTAIKVAMVTAYLVLVIVHRESQDAPLL